MESYLVKRAEHLRTARPGVEAARELSMLTDEAVRELSRAASSRIDGRWSLVALGGWGSGALLPASDLDILVLSDVPAERLKPFVEAVLYPLWDAGLKVGHQVRSPRQQRKAMREDMMTCTAALTARPLAGDADWATESIAHWVADARKRSARILSEVTDRERPGSPYLLEPDLKQGAGGRRDYDELTWRAALAGGSAVSDCSALVESGLLEPAEYATVSSASRVVAAARWELQRDGHGDRMTIEASQDLRSCDPEAVQEALAETALVLRRVRTGPDARNEDACQQPLVPERVFELLGDGEDALDELEVLVQQGRLEGLVPGMRRLMSTRRPGLGHRLTVGAHCLKAATLVAHPDAGGALGRSRDAIEDLRPLRVAALVHDLGKAGGGADHAERGALPAVDAARRFGLEHAADDVGALVRHHLLLVETALREDLDDEDTILRCASRLGSGKLVAPLHLLTAADSLATGPSTWTPWTEALIGTLVSRVDAAFAEEVDGAGLAGCGEQVRAEALLLVPEASAESGFVQRAPLRYLASRGAADVARDARLVSRLMDAPAAAGAHIGVSIGPVAGTHTITIAAADRPRLLSRLAGAIALAGLDILSVDAHKAARGVALDVFTVTSATGRPVDAATFSAVERFTRAVLGDRLETAVRLAERGRHYRCAVSCPVTVDVRPHGWATEIAVTAPDRPGLLHDIALAVSEAGIDISWAKVQTIDGVARDIFHLVDVQGGPVTDHGVLGHVSMRIRESV